MSHAAGEKIPFTFADYLALPDDGRRYQVIEGELVEMYAPALRHQRLLGELFVLLHGHVNQGPGGLLLFAPFDVVLEDTNVFQPDLLYVAPEHADRVTEKRGVGPPDLVVEVLSDGSRGHDRVRKMRVYARRGVSWYWIVDPDTESLEEFQLDGARYRQVTIADRNDVFRPGLFPGLEVPLDALFAR